MNASRATTTRRPITSRPRPADSAPDRGEQRQRQGEGEHGEGGRARPVERVEREVLHDVGDHLDLAAAEELGRRERAERPREHDERRRRRCRAWTAAASPARRRAPGCAPRLAAARSYAGSMWLIAAARSEDHRRHREVHEADEHAALGEEHRHRPGHDGVAEHEHPGVGAHDGAGEERREREDEEPASAPPASRRGPARRPPGRTATRVSTVVARAQHAPCPRPCGGTAAPGHARKFSSVSPPVWSEPGTNSSTLYWNSAPSAAAKTARTPSGGRQQELHGRPAEARPVTSSRCSR